MTNCSALCLVIPLLCWQVAFTQNRRTTDRCDSRTVHVNLQEFQRTVYEVNGGVRLEVSVEEQHENVAKRYFTNTFCEHQWVQEKLFTLLSYFVCNHFDGE